MRSRERKAILAYLSRPIVPLGPDRWTIRSRKRRDGTTGEPYVIYRAPNGALQCKCEGFKSDSSCKHIEALQKHLSAGPPAYYRNLNEDDLTYGQDWTRYNAATDVMDDAVLGLLRCLGREQFPVGYTRGPGRPAKQRCDLFLAIGLRAYESASGRASQGFVRKMFEQGLLASTDGPKPEEPKTSTITSEMRDSDMLEAFEDALALTAEQVSQIEAKAGAVFALDSKEYNTPNRYPSNELSAPDDTLPRELRRTTIKGHVLVGTASKICVSAAITHGKSGDSLQLQRLVSKILGRLTIKALCADKAYLSTPHLEFLDQFRIYPAIPPKATSKDQGEARLAQHVRHWLTRTNAEKDIYGMRQIVESYHAMTMRNTTEDLRSRTFSAQSTELMSMFVVVNCMRLVHLYIEEPTFDITFLDAPTRALLDAKRKKVASRPRHPKAPKPQRKTGEHAA